MNAVLRLTWKELIRKRVTLMTMIMTVLFWIAFWYIARSIAFVPSEQNLLVTDLYILTRKLSQGATILSLGFFFAGFALSFLSIFSSVAAVTGEAEHGILQSVLARPLPRYKWMIGRWGGFTLFGLSYACILFATILFITWFHTGLTIEFITGIKCFLLFVSVVPLLVTLSMLGSCWLSPLGNGIGMTLLYGMGWLGGMIEKVNQYSFIGNETKESLSLITGLITLIMPADALNQRMLSELMPVSNRDVMSLLGGSFGVTVPSNAFLIYAACYIIVTFALAIVVIKKKDF